jgi:hypothetical protein
MRHRRLPDISFYVVIPGRAEGASPESIVSDYLNATARGYGFRTAASRRPE